MTASELFAEHKGGHCAPPVSPAVAMFRFFRRAIAAARGKPAVPAAIATAGAATALPAGAEPVLRNGTIAEARARQDAWTAEDIAVTGRPLPRRVPGASLAITPLPAYVQKPVADVLEAGRLGRELLT